LKKYDYIIVGQGIAGSLVAYQLLKQHKSILVIDRINPNSSSNIAAGVVNPVTGRKMVKSWLIDELLPFAGQVYRELEALLGISFFYDVEIYKFISSQTDVELWQKRKSEPEYRRYIGEIIDLGNPSLHAPLGVGVIKESCWMDVPKFITAFRNYLVSLDCFIDDSFDVQTLYDNEVIRHKDAVAENIIFCEGYKAYQNPLFKHITFSAAKGEHLVISAPDLDTSTILSKNIYLIPKGNQMYNVGSTFIWDDYTEQITDQGRNDITEKLNKMISCPYEIIEEKAAVRPTMIDRRPVIGRHPDYKNVFIFNGMGTKGVSLAPFFSARFVSSIDAGLQDYPEISINRFVN
jgi:glycine oxidase